MIRGANHWRAEGRCRGVEWNRVRLRRHSIERHREPWWRNRPRHRCHGWGRRLWQAGVGSDGEWRSRVRRGHGGRRVEQDAIHGSRRLRRIIGAGAGDPTGKLMHHGRTMGKIPMMMVTWDPSGGEILLLKRHRVPFNICSGRDPLCSLLRRGLDRGRGRRGMALGGNVVRVTVIPGGFLLVLGFLASLTRGFGDSPFLQPASQLGFTWRC